MFDCLAKLARRFQSKYNVQDSNKNDAPVPTRDSREKLVSPTSYRNEESISIIASHEKYLGPPLVYHFNPKEKTIIFKVAGKIDFVDFYQNKIVL